jgi:hypothetical protein
MTGGLTLDLILPALVLTAMGWAVPRLLFHVFPEGVKPLILLAICSTLIMMVLGIVFFTVLYLAQGINWAVLLRDGWGAFLLHFLKLGLISALLWGPIMLLAVASLPKRWKEEVW